MLLTQPHIMVAFVVSLLILMLLHPFVSERPYMRYAVATLTLLWLALNAMITASGLALVAIIALLMAAAVHPRVPYRGQQALALISTLSILLLAINSVPAAHTSVLVADFFMGNSLTPNTLLVSYNKAIAALLILAIWWPHLTDKGSYSRMTRALPLAIAAAALIILMACSIGLQWDPKWYWFSAVFVLTNLALTCVAEEVFFRGLLQRQFSRYFSKYKFGALAALLLVSLLFGAAHIAAGLAYASLATLAGLAYGVIYWRYRSLHAAILCHWLVNVIHIAGFRYPWGP